MKSLAFTRANDLIAPVIPSNNGLTISLAPLTGVWHSTNEETRGIIKLILSDSEGVLLVQCFGAGGSSTIDWGTIHAAAFAGRAGTTKSGRRQGSRDFGFFA